jgi:hypothetical protein
MVTVADSKLDSTVQMSLQRAIRSSKHIQDLLSESSQALKLKENYESTFYIEPDGHQN